MAAKIWRHPEIVVSASGRGGTSVIGGPARALEMLAGEGIELTLVDVGASLEPFPPFRPLLGRATYVGFDPDLREMHAETNESSRRIIVNKAVVADAGRGTATFFLTRNPTASSTLRPDPDELAPYLHAYRYQVVGEAEVAAVTLDDALAAAGLDRVDWLKLDTQGTDLRLIESMGEPLSATLMAVDAEPGLDPYYETEDTFGDLHRAMVERGYWLADLAHTPAVRLRRSTFDAALGARSKFGRMRYEFSLKASPIAVGPRYLRTLASLDKAGAGRNDYLRLWACAAFSGNNPYALDVLVECRARHGDDRLTARLLDVTVRRNRADARRATWRLVEKVNLRNLKRFVTKSY
jgi:FkbM family methyltransferase